MLNNNIIPKKELMDPKKRLKKKINLRKKLRTVEEASNEESEDSHQIKKNNSSNYDLAVPSAKKADIKSRIQALKEKKNKAKEE